MKFSEQWCREFVNPGISTEALCEQLTMAGLEVDGCHPVAGEFSQVFVGQVLSVTPHPNADKLRCCQVTTGDQTVELVCGGKNVRENLRVAIAMQGAVLPNGMTIKPTTIRDVASNGMLCSASELGLADTSDGIMELPEDAPIGANLQDYLQLNDVTIDVDLTPNRGDCLSILGIAREIAALTTSDLQSPDIKPIAATIDDTVEVILENPQACPHYVGRVIKGIDNRVATPMWMQEKLRRCGLRSISAVVDIMNFVMLEIGQPMHAFDVAKLNQPIVVKTGQKGQPLKLLDESQATLVEDTLVIADQKNTLAIAGIMGGDDSAVTLETRDVFLESAFFHPDAIINKARAYGLATDSSHRFERGVDTTIQVMAIERATQLILDIVGGQAGPVVNAKSEQHLPQQELIVLRPERVERILGLRIAEDTIIDILQRLGLQVFAQGDRLEVHIPSHRFDLNLEIDLIEEIARVYGYQEIPERVIHSDLIAQNQSETKIDHETLWDVLQQRGFQEAITYSFVNPTWQNTLFPDNQAVPLLNPIASDLSDMRVSLWPGLLQAVQYNQHRHLFDQRLFEVGLRFVKRDGQLQQIKTIAGVISGKINADQWHSQARDVDFFDLKADVEALLALSRCQDQFRFVADSLSCLHPGQSARIERDGKTIGWMGVLHPTPLQQLDLQGPVIVFECDVEPLVEARLPKYQAVSKFQGARRDLSFLVDADVTADQITDAVRSMAPEIIQRVQIFDIYQGKNIPDGKKSMAIAMFLQDRAQTLIDQVINDCIESVVNHLQDVFAIQLRE